MSATAYNVDGGIESSTAGEALGLTDNLPGSSDHFPRG